MWSKEARTAALKARQKVAREKRHAEIEKVKAQKAKEKEKATKTAVPA